MINIKNLKKLVLDNYKFALSIRRRLHSYPEIGFDVDNTVSVICEKIKEIGYIPIPIGKNGIIVNIKGKTDKTILLRSDIDALPIKEKTSYKYKSKNDYMHACGHDIHCASLLGALKIIKENEDMLINNLKIVFQPNEENLLGAKNLIEEGLLINPKVDEAFFIHVLPLKEIKKEKIILPPFGIISPSCDYFKITIKGKSTHASSPHLGKDPIIPGIHIVSSLESVMQKEVSLLEQGKLTVCSFISENSYNVISGRVTIKGSLRLVDSTFRNYIKQRIKHIANHISSSFNVLCKVEFVSETPCLQLDENIKNKITPLINKYYSKDEVIDSSLFKKSISTGSEDFAYISELVPTYMFSLPFKSEYSLHNEKLVIPEELLINGMYIFSLLALVYK